MNEKLESYMMDFSLQSLKGFLGEQLVDTLVEWIPSDELFFTKKRLIRMILTIHGVKIMANPLFRKELLKKLDTKEIKLLGKLILSKESELEPIIEDICKKNWANNAISHEILKLFEVRSDILENHYEDKDIIEKVESNERFFELLDYQFYIKQQLLNFLNNHNNHRKKILVQMPTGTGKTKTTTHTLVNYFTFSQQKQGLIIWVAHTTELLQQAYNTLKNVWAHLGEGQTNIYRIWGNAKISLEENMNGFAFCGIQKLSAIKKSNSDLYNQLIDNCRVFVFDEAHKVAAKETSKVVSDFMYYGEVDRTLIGLTATPGRTTKNSFDNKLLSNIFDNRLLGINLDIVYQMNTSVIEYMNMNIEDNIIKYFQNMNVLAHIKKRELEYKQDFTEAELSSIKRIAKYNGYKDFSKKALETIGRNKSRNVAIMDMLRELHQQKKVVIVFACSVEQAKILSAMLQLEDIPNALVLGEMSRIEREKCVSDFKDRNNLTNIIINYEVLTTGFDATNINCVFIARPTQSVVLYSQMLGRGLRGKKMGGNGECLLIDVKDNLTQFNEEMAFTRFEDYWNA